MFSKTHSRSIILAASIAAALMALSAQPVVNGAYAACLPDDKVNNTTAQDATKAMDDSKRKALRDAGYKVVVFTEDKSGWPAVFAKYPFIFGRGSA